MRIQILGAHNCEAEKTKLPGLLIDNILAIDAGSLTSSLSLSEQLELQAILLTHHHYDHIRDIPTIAMNAFLHETTINVYSTQTVYDALSNYLLNDELYPNFLKKPEVDPAIKFTLMSPHHNQQIADYEILTVQVIHSTSAVGYQITAADGKTLFYTGDTGPGLAECWRQISPDLIIIEVTAPNRYEEFARAKGHLTPNLLGEELGSFQGINSYIPQVITVHMNPRQENEIETEIAAMAKATNYPVRPGHEGMLIHL
ncbi:MBL fold metallo-hydrolase [Chloroflexota bacterium]